jgi:hypothetical protein
MNMYNEVVRLHRNNAGLWSLFKEIGSEAQKYEIVVLLVSFVSIIVLIVLVSNNQANDVYKWLLGSLEVFTLFVLDAIKSSRFGNQYLFANDDRHKTARYCLFEEAVERLCLSKEQVINILSLLNAEIDLVTESKINSRIVLQIGLPLLAAAFFAYASRSEVSSEVLLVSILLGIGVYILLHMIVSVLRSHTAELKELVLFLIMFNQRDNR